MENLPLTSLSESTNEEEKRLFAAYAKRSPGNLYSRFNPAYLIMVQQRELEFLRLLRQHRHDCLESKSVLEIGCGTGDLIRDFIKWGVRPKNIVGIELLPDRIREAVELCPKETKIYQGNAAKLHFPNESFDLVVQATAFTSVLNTNMKRQMAAEMHRVVKTHGLILWYDYYMDNPNNADVRGIKKNEIHTLFPGCQIELRRITLAPPIARLLAPYSSVLCYLLQQIPWLCTHYLGVIRKAD